MLYILTAKIIIFRQNDKKNRKEEILCKPEEGEQIRIAVRRDDAKRGSSVKYLKTLRVALTEEENKGLSRFGVIR